MLSYFLKLVIARRRGSAAPLAYLKREKTVWAAAKTGAFFIRGGPF